MANIGKIKGITGWQGSDQSCDKVSLYDLRNYIDLVVVQSTSGTQYIYQTTAGANSPFASVKNFECGSGSLFFRKGEENSWNTFNIPHYEQGNVADNGDKLVTTLFPDEFTIEGKGTFHLTSGDANQSKAWYSNMPVYKLANNSINVWYNGSSYVRNHRNCKWWTFE